MKKSNVILKRIMVAILSVAVVFSFVIPLVGAGGGNPSDPPVIEGDSTRLKVKKRVFLEGEPVLASGVGSGKDWVGIYTVDGKNSIRFFYVRDVGSNVFFDLRQGTSGGDSSHQDLRGGDYIIRLMPNDSTDISKAISSARITIKSEPIPAPTGCTYVLDNNSDGYASGVVKVKLTAEQVARNVDISMYWANENGKLKGYSSLAKFKGAFRETSFRIPDGVVIPEGATKLLVYTSVPGTESEKCITIDLPENAASKDFGKPLFTYNVCSDIHITANKNSTHNRRFQAMLENVAVNQPDSEGVFIVGDMADSGSESEYINMCEIHENVKKQHPNLANLYLTIGNHDLGLGSKDNLYNEEVALFLKYAKKPDGSHPDSLFYDFWLNGYHFIFVGNDKLVNGVRATFSRESLDWLDKTIGENYSPYRPAFIFLHQSIKNTVAGSLDGQGWDGVVNEADWRNILSKYPEAIMFNGHSHWIMDSESNMYTGDPLLPTIFNTASIGYEWSSYEDVHSGGYHAEGSEGYVIDVYGDKVVVRGKEYTKDEWKPSAYYCIEYKMPVIRHSVKYVLDGGTNTRRNPAFFTEGKPVELHNPSKSGYTFKGWFKDENFTEEITQLSGNKNLTIYAKWEKKPVAPDNPDSSDDQSGNEDSGNDSSHKEEPNKKGGCKSAMGGGSGLVMAIIPLLAIIKRKIK